MSELDKFKRRTIRSVARLLLKEKKPPEKVWAEMKKETGTDCRVLWERMRALCIKKVNRMIAVDDRSANLPSIARLSLTDWLLVDLVLVHEKIDVIMMDNSERKEYPALVELFNLVQRFDIEGQKGSDLAEAWAAATVYYNRQGRQCSPMLLQRRWYQLKKLTRSRFYNFWQSYRGNTRLLSEAKKTMPTRLQMIIAKRYPKVITSEFPDWEDLIEKKFIILPGEFEAKMRLPNLPKPCNSNDPDLVLVEPVIETIDLRIDSDPDDPNVDFMDDISDPEKSNDATDIHEEKTENNEHLGVKIKTEPMEQDGLSNVQVISTTHVPEVEIPDDSPEESPAAPSPCQETEGNVGEIISPEDNIEMTNDQPTLNVDPKEPADSILATTEVPKVSNIAIENSSDVEEEDDVIEIPSTVPTVNIDTDLPIDNIVEAVTAVAASKAAEVPPQNDRKSSDGDVVPLSDSDDIIDDIIKVKADEYCRKETEESPSEVNHTFTVDDLIKYKADTFLKKPIEDTSLNDKKPDVSSFGITNMAIEETAIDLMADLNFVDDGIEFVDDGVEFVEDEDSQKIEPTFKQSPKDQNNEDAEESNKFDLKLLMDPVVYTTRLDQMKIFLNKPFNLVENIQDIENAALESKPVSKKSFSVNTTVQQQTVTSMMNDEEDKDDLFTNPEEMDEEDEEIHENVVVSPTSYMLAKPKTRSYNPIMLCKNPDFNTKLKRLTIGFLSSTRNRHLLNACIPMTIDLSKTFESKLVNGTMYLKSSGVAPKMKQEIIDKQASSIVPSAMAVQCLLDNSKLDSYNLVLNPPLEPSIVNERKKVINLPDIDKVRRINQQLLTAQVPPLRVYAGNSHKARPPPTPIVHIPNEVDVSKEHVPEISSSVPIAAPTVRNQPSDTVTVPTTKDTETINDVPSNQSTLPTVIKVENKEIVNVAQTTTPTTPPEILPPAKEKLLKIINQAKISTQEALAKIDKGIDSDNTEFPRPIVVKKVKSEISTRQDVPKKHSMYQRVPVAWAPKFATGPKNIDDFLLTSDTLNKMLHLLMNDDKDGKGCTCSSVKSKNTTKKVKAKKLSQEIKQTESKNPVSEVQEDNISKPAEKEAAPNTIQDPPSAEINLVDSPPAAPPKKVARGRIFKYCCWAKQKICNRKRITKHTCLPDDCKCCCRDLLAVKIFEDAQRKTKDLEMGQKDGAIELSDDEDTSLRKACESIENVVQQSREISVDTQNKTVEERSMVIEDTSTHTNAESMSAPNQSLQKVSVGVGTSTTGIVNEITKTQQPPFVITRIKAAPDNVVRLPQEKPDPITKLTQLRPRVLHSSQYLPCSCQKPAVSQDTQRNIVIDGSKNCPIHPLSLALKPEKVIYLHSKNMADKPTSSPIFLGINKILLTTVKFPRKTVEVAAPSEVIQSPNIIPTLPVPVGVQLVLMPSGCVTYTLDPGVELDEAQLASLPTLIAAVQEQLNAAGIPSVASGDPQASTTGPNLQPDASILRPEINSVSETSNLKNTGDSLGDTEPQSQKIITSGDSDLPQTEDNTITKTTEQPPPITLTTNEVFQEPELSSNDTSKEHMEVDATDNTNVDAPTQATTNVTKNMAIPTTENAAKSDTVDRDAPKDNIILNEETVATSQIPSAGGSGVQSEIKVQEAHSLVENNEGTKKLNDQDGVNNRKSLLSDLMEMSGISAEDTTAPEPLVPDPPIADPISTEKVQDTPNILNAELVSADQAKNLPELSPVTSFSELKYACEQNGRFFKLDLETGAIVPINVCIKKNPKNKLRQKPKEVIDLTEDVESIDTQDTEQMQSHDMSNPVLRNTTEYSYKGKTVSITSCIKPVKLFRAIRPIPTVLKRSKKVMTGAPFINKQTHIEKRKQNLNKVEAKIDLVDSDAPMEEEYLLESSDDDFTPDGEPMLVEALNFAALDSGDSSDDEPLAKKSKRLRRDQKENNIIETNIYDEISDEPLNVPKPSELTLNVRKDLGVPLDTPSQVDNNGSSEHTPPKKPSPSSDTVPTTTNTSLINVRSDIVSTDDNSSEFDEDEENNAEPELRFMMSIESENEGDNEDCILGV